MKKDEKDMFVKETRIGNLSWPFIRHKILISKPSNKDVFEWLFLSLVLLTNANNNREKETCGSSVINEVKFLMKTEFNGLIDNQTVDRVAENVSKKYVRDSSLTKEALLYSSEFETVFTDDFEIRYIFQDSLTKEILPWFYSEEGLIDTDLPRTDRKTEIISIESLNESLKDVDLSNKAVMNASRQYRNIRRFGRRGSGYEEYDNIEDVNDVPLETDSGDIKFSSRVLETDVEYLNVPVDLVNNKICLRSPFIEATNYWMEGIYVKARNVCKKFDDYAKKHFDIHIKNEDEKRKIIRTYEESGGKSPISDDLSELYRLIEGYDDDELRLVVFNMDGFYRIKDRTFFLNCGFLLEMIVFKINYAGKTIFTNRKMGYNRYCERLMEKLGDAEGYYPLLKDEMYYRWKKRMKYDDWNKKFAFKPDLVEVILETDMTQSPLFKKKSISNMTYMYKLRNMVAHNDVKSRYLKPEKKHIEYMEDIIRLFNDVYGRA